jgi:hypothetical protein
MASLWESLFGAATSRPQHPASRGALLGAGYQAMPDMRASLEDRRPEGEDYTVGMRKSRPGWFPDYWPSEMEGVDPWSGGQFSGGYDPLVASPLIAKGRKAPAPGDYTPSFQPNLQSPHQGYFPAAPASPSSDSDLPYIGAHLPWGPGELGWTPPPPPTPLPSRPLSRRGMTLNSNPWGY